LPADADRPAARSNSQPSDRSPEFGRGGSSQPSVARRGDYRRPGPPFSAERVAVDSNVVRIAFSGELDIATAPLAEEQFREASHDGSLVVLDLRDLAFIDSTGLRSILSAVRQVRTLGGRVVVIPGQGQVRKVFEITNVAAHLEIVDGAAPDDDVRRGIGDDGERRRGRGRAS
jgi:anti-anti-sigma factor